MSIGSIGNTGSALSLLEMQQELFNRADINGDSGIDSSEFQNIFSRIQDSVDISSEAEELFSQLDANSDGTIDETEHAEGSDSIKEMLDSYAPEMPPPPPTSSNSMMEELDTNGDGVISLEEMQAAGESNQTEDANKPDINEIFSSIDTNGDGVIDAEENEAAASKMNENQGHRPPPPPEEEENNNSYFSQMATAAYTASAADTINAVSMTA